MSAISKPAPLVKVKLTTDEKAMLQLRQGIRRDPAAYCTELFGDKLWSRQIDLLCAPFRYTRSAFGTGHAVGKSFIAPRQIVLWMISHAPCYVVVTSSNWAATKFKLMDSVASAVKAVKYDIFPESSLPTSEHWKLSEEWTVVAISPDKTEPAAGWHSKGGTLIVVDEAHPSLSVTQLPCGPGRIELVFHCGYLGLGHFSTFAYFSLEPFGTYPLFVGRRHREPAAAHFRDDTSGVSIGLLPRESSATVDVRQVPPPRRNLPA